MITCVHDGHGTQRDSEAKLIFIGCQKIYQTEPPYSYELSTPWYLGICVLCISPERVYHSKESGQLGACTQCNQAIQIPNQTLEDLVAIICGVPRAPVLAHFCSLFTYMIFHSA